MKCTIENAGNPAIAVFKWQVGDRRGNRMFLTIHLMMRATMVTGVFQRRSLCVYVSVNDIV